MSKEPFAARLRRLRKENKYTQEHLAKIADISVQTIRNYEQEIVTKPSCEYLLELAKILDVTAEYLLLGDDNVNNYTMAISKELRQLDADQILKIKQKDLNETILAHLEMSEKLVTEIINNWSKRKLFDKYCTRQFVQDVILKYCQNRKELMKTFKIENGFKNCS